MNNIVYAGKDAERAKELAAARKYWQFVRCGARGEIEYGRTSRSFARGDVIAAPPLAGFARSENAADAYIFMEGTALPFKAPKIISEEAGGGFAHAFTQAERYFETADTKSTPVLKALGDLIVSYIIAQTERAAYSPIVENVRADIAANVSNTSYALDAYMRALPLNSDYVRKLFKSEVGISPHDYLLNLRMNLASQLILSGMSNQYSKYSISQIAEMCGFAEPLYFSRVFKKKFGVPPSEYGGK